jgi:hypothetical protein
MTFTSDQKFEELLYNYLKENKGTAFTIDALEEILKNFLRKVKKNDRKNHIYQHLLSMKQLKKVDLVEHNGKLHYFYLKIFDYEKYRQNKIYYLVPKHFISAGKGSNRIKTKYCKNCKKEVVLQHRYRPQNISIWFPTLSYYSDKNVEARRKTGWFCPMCNKKF